MKHILHFGAISVFALLTACGGGSGSSSSPTGGAGTGGSTLPAMLISAANIESFATVAVNTPEGMLQIGHYADTLAVEQQVSFGNLQLCANGGARTVHLTGGLPLQQGSVIRDVLEDCQVDALDAVLNGEVSFTVTQVQQTATQRVLTLQVDLTKAVFKDSPQLTMKDPVKVSLTTAPLLKQIVVEPINASVRFELNNGDSFSVSQFMLSSRFDLSTALYQHQFQGRIAFGGFSRDLAFKTAQPLQGFIGEYPHQGRVELSDSQNNLLSLTANQVADSESAIVKFNTANHALYHWSAIGDDAFWTWPGLGSQSNVRKFRHDNFEMISQIGKTNYADFPSQGRISYLFSRPVKEVKSSSLTNFFNSIEWGFDDIGARVQIEGAVVHIQPLKALQPGATYRLGSFEAKNSLDRQTYVHSSQNVTISKAVIAVLTKDRISFSTSSAPVLSADKSQLVNATGVSYQWQELSSHGVIFDSPNSVSTSFRVPNAKADQVVEIRLTVQDGLGNSHSADSTFFFHDSSLNVFYYESDRGDYIGAGQTRFLTSQNGTLRATSNVKSRIRGSYDGQEDQFSIWWYMNFATADDKELVPGVYQNATREPFKPEAGNGLSITGNGRGCNTLKGSFEIFEIEFSEVTNSNEGYDKYKISKLALDYVQHCEGQTPAMRGKIRINTDYKL